MEKTLIRWLTERFGSTGFAKIGIGDDCAVLPQTDADLIVTCDAICEGVHFRSSELTPQQIGRKALAVNLSDLASMGADARAALVSLTLPRNCSLEFAQQIFIGMEPLATKYGVDICGGDTTTWDGGLVVSVTAIGLAPETGAWQISGARPGDQIVVSGQFGGSILGHHWSFEPRLDFVKQWRGVSGLIHACTDVSDSLGFDLAKMATASELGFMLDLDSVPIANDAEKLASTTGRTALDHALIDGEDFELILAVDPEWLQQVQDETANVKLTRIGEFTGEREMAALQAGKTVPFHPAGYEHRLDQGPEDPLDD